ncbi:hypothetical protein BDV95DRAFT_605569 [Massariosphaeria phaeospora]|uniref:HCP-like protein n=1 Tax=Massariosphaeria phaeospora TaxID=100035 RepID=A0A7C8IHE5_9PLEO|nr:hypothetical protein BDV95DRAFT_605569 [Massariosphaeria phaeospora]
MAYQQQHSNQQQQRQQYLSDGYGYDQGQGQYDQPPNGRHDQPQGNGWGDGQPERAGQMRQPPPQGRAPPPRDQYGQAYDEQMSRQPQPQPQGRDPRGRPMGSNAPQPQGRMPHGDGRARPPQQGQPGPRPSGRDRALIPPNLARNPSQDNPFPTFPAQTGKPHPDAGSIDGAMSRMSLEGENDRQGRPMPPQSRGHGEPRPLQHRGPAPGRGAQYSNPDMHRQDSGHFEGRQQPVGRDPRARPMGPNETRSYPDQRPPPMNVEGARGPVAPRQYDPTSPLQQTVGPNMQRSNTMPHNMSGPARPYEPPRQQWTEPAAVSGYSGPQSPTFIPPRPSTAGGTRSNGYPPPQQFVQRPPVPQMPPAQQQYQQQYQQQQHQPQHQHQYRNRESHGHVDIDNLYDDYYGASPDRQSKAASIEMPDFDAIPDTSHNHRRGYSIEDHLSPALDPSAHGANPALAGAGDAASRRDHFHQQAARSRSQPDLHGQYSQANGVYEVPSDAPPLPMAIPAYAGSNAMANAHPGRGPPSRGMTMDSLPSRGPDQSYGASQPQNFDPRYRRQQPPVHRGYSGESAYSEPGTNAMRNGSPMVPGNPVPRPGTAAPAPGRMPSDPLGRRPGTSHARPSNPDALPAHPTPVRAGLMQQDQRAAPQASRPPPVRQHNTEPSPVGYGNQQVPSASAAPQRRVSVPHPVTHDEINRLRNMWKTNPSDSESGLKLAKKLVEASNVLADENGTADARTRNKNREKYIFEAHKIMKKLVAAGSAEAMFYFADCWGQGLLGLQVDMKEAFTLYQSAAKAGHPASAYRTAVCCEMGHEEGGGTKKDYIKAVQWYKRAAALGDTPALYKMGMILLKGLLGQQKNLGEAINMLKRAAERADEQNPHALHELGLIYEAQTGNEKLIRDEPYAFSLFNQAADLGYKFSQFRLGQAYEYGLLGCQIDARSSIGWYTRAAAQEEHQSELALSGWYLTGSQGILEQSDTEAYLWARKAACAEPPLPKALFAMGYFTEVGIGCPRSLEEAKRWYGRAASYKFPKAQERLEELKRGGSKVQMKRERLSRSNQKQHEENCVVM